MTSIDADIGCSPVTAYLFSPSLRPNRERVLALMPQALPFSVRTTAVTAMIAADGRLDQARAVAVSANECQTREAGVL